MMSSDSMSRDWIFYLFLGLLFLMPIPFGSNTPLTSSGILIVVILISIVWCLGALLGRRDITQAFLKAKYGHACFLFLLLMNGLQLLPLNFWGSGCRPVELYEQLYGAKAHITVSCDWGFALSGLLESLGYYLTFCLVLLLVNSHRKALYIIFVIVLAGFVQALYGVYMVLTGEELTFLAVKEHYIGSATGTFINRNHFAGFLEMSMALGIGLLIAQLSRVNEKEFPAGQAKFLNLVLSGKAVLRLALIVMVVGLVLSKSRLGNIAFFTALCMGFIVYGLMRSSLSKTHVLLFFSFVIVDLLLVSGLIGVDGLVHRMQMTSLEAELRDEVYQDALRIFADHMWFGIGAGSFELVYPLYRSAEVSQYFDHVHNDYLELALELGVFAFVAMMVLYIMSICVAARAIKERNRRLYRGIGFGACTGIIALLIHSLGDFNLQIPSNAMLFIVLLALCWVARYQKS